MDQTEWVIKSMWQELKDEVRDRHLFLDFGIRSWLEGYRQTGGEIFCRKGCHHCCDLAVHATLTEALCISEILAEEQFAAVDQKVSLILEECRSATDLATYLAQSRKRTGFCPLLSKEGACSIYSLRPFSCRALISTKPSSFCCLDFSGLSTEEKERYLQGLDKRVVAFPLHYAAATRELGAGHEEAAMRRMVTRFGFSIYGNLALLLYLERTHGLSSMVTEGYQRTVELIKDAGCNSPFLLTLTGPITE